MGAGMRREERWACQMEGDHGGLDVEGVGQQRVSSRQPQPAYQTRHCLTQEEQGDARGAVESKTRGKSEGKGRRGVPQKGRSEGVGTEGMEVRHRRRSGTRGKISFILSHTNQNMGPRRDVTPSPGGGGIVNQLRTRRSDVNGRSGRTRRRRRRRRHLRQGCNSMWTNVRDTRKSRGNAVWRGGGNRGFEGGQGSKFKAPTERQDSRTQGTVGVTLHGEEGDVGGG